MRSRRPHPWLFLIKNSAARTAINGSPRDLLGRGNARHDPFPRLAFVYCSAGQLFRDLMQAIGDYFNSVLANEPGCCNATVRCVNGKLSLTLHEVTHVHLIEYCGT